MASCYYLERKLKTGKAFFLSLVSWVSISLSQRWERCWNQTLKRINPTVVLLSFVLISAVSPPAILGLIYVGEGNLVC